jgi:hypothetical protein
MHHHRHASCIAISSGGDRVRERTLHRKLRETKYGMHGSKARRGSAARIIGWGLVALVYATVLVWAGALTAAQPMAVEQSAQAAAGPVAGTVVAATGADGVEMAPVSAILTPTEAPLVTLGIALAMVVAVGGWYLLRTFRARHPHVRGARLIARHITTLL